MNEEQQKAYDNGMTVNEWEAKGWSLGDAKQHWEAKGWEVTAKVPLKAGQLVTADQVEFTSRRCHSPEIDEISRRAVADLLNDAAVLKAMRLVLGPDEADWSGKQGDWRKP